MAFSPGWDGYDARTLRFRDPDLERAYQNADQVEGVRRVRSASLVAVGVWLCVAVIGPPSVGIPPGTTWLVSGTMAALLLASAGLSRLATTQRRREAIGIGQQIAAGLAVLILTGSTGTFGSYALPGMMLTAVFGFSITRHPFVGGLAVGGAYCVLFLGFAIGLDLTGQLPLQLFILAATVVGASLGSYLLERSQRVSYAQGRLVAALHDRVNQLLHEYLSPEVASALIEDPSRAALGGEVAEVTVLFADLRNYTAFAERTSPAEVVGHLNALFGAAVPIVLGEGGTVVQFMGDAMMAVFNVPHEQPDHALRAARAALGMQRTANEMRLEDSLPRFRVGLNSGPALVGNIGAAEIRNFSAIGDTTNLAARLQTYAPEGSIVIGPSTYDLIREQAIVRPLGAPELKGKSQAVEVYELLGLRDDR